MPPNLNVVLRQKGTVKAVFDGGKRGYEVVFFGLCDLSPYTDLGVLVSSEDLGGVECDGLGGPGRWVVVECVDKGIVG